MAQRGSATSIRGMAIKDSALQEPSDKLGGGPQSILKVGNAHCMAATSKSH
jgi:hypothetical protein